MLVYSSLYGPDDVLGDGEFRKGVDLVGREERSRLLKWHTLLLLKAKHEILILEPKFPPTGDAAVWEVASAAKEGQKAPPPATAHVREDTPQPQEEPKAPPPAAASVREHTSAAQEEPKAPPPEAASVREETRAASESPQAPPPAAASVRVDATSKEEIATKAAPRSQGSAAHRSRTDPPPKAPRT